MAHFLRLRVKTDEKLQSKSVEERNFDLYWKIPIPKQALIFKPG